MADTTAATRPIVQTIERVSSMCSRMFDVDVDDNGGPIAREVGIETMKTDGTSSERSED